MFYSWCEDFCQLFEKPSLNARNVLHFGYIQLAYYRRINLLDKIQRYFGEEHHDKL